jgi:hypothetical protein
MQQKIDKEYLIKNRFWVSLPAIALFMLIGFFCVLGVRGSADAFFKKAEARNNELERIKKDQELRNSKWIAAIDRERQAAVDQMTLVWNQEFDRQNGVVHDAEGRKIRDPLITWPTAMENMPVGKHQRPLKDHDYGEPVGTNRPWFNELDPAYELQYKDQFNDIRKIVDLMDEKAGTGSVRVRGSSKSHWDNALDLLAPHALTPNRRVLSDEAWLLQEDVAIKRELFKAIAGANNLVANLQPEWRLLTSLPEQLKSPATGGEPVSSSPGGVPPAAAPSPQPAPPSPGEKTDKPEEAKKGTSIDHQRFLNSTWQVGFLELTIKDGKEVVAPHTRWWEGWFLDLDLVDLGQDEFALHGFVANLGNLHKIPAAKVAVVLEHEYSQPKQQSIIIDLPELAKSSDDATSKVYKAQLDGTLDFTTLAAMPVTKQPLKVDLKGKLPDRFHPKRLVQVRRAPPPGSGNPADRSKVFDHQRFANDFWVFDVQLVSGATGFNRALQGVLYNHSGRRLAAPKFDVTISDGDNSENDWKQTVEVPGDKLNALNARGESGERDRRTFPRPGAGPIKVERPHAFKEIVAVRQVLDWQTVPVKRIDQLELGTNAHKENDRVKVVALKRYDFTRKSTVPVPQEVAPTDQGTPAGAGVP